MIQDTPYRLSKSALSGSIVELIEKEQCSLNSGAR